MKYGGKYGGKWEIWREVGQMAEIMLFILLCTSLLELNNTFTFKK